jgi:hypothetical protein
MQTDDLFGATQRTVGVITLNPERDSVVTVATAAEDIQPLAA